MTDLLLQDVRCWRSKERTAQVSRLSAFIPTSAAIRTEHALSRIRRWIHCFEVGLGLIVIDLDLVQLTKRPLSVTQNVTAVLFLAAISGYDQGLIEDRDSVGPFFS